MSIVTETKVAWQLRLISEWKIQGQ